MPEENNMNGLEIFRQIPLFKAIKDDEQALRKVIAHFVNKKYKSGELILNEGEEGNELYVLLAGSVDILKKTQSGDSYTMNTLVASQNVFFGEMALIGDGKRTATVKTNSDSEFLVINDKNYDFLGEKEPLIVSNINKQIALIIAERLRKTTEDMLILFDALISEI